MNPSYSYVYFALKGDDFDPVEVTRRLGIEPTSAWRKGEISQYISATKFALWEWRTGTEALLIDQLIDEVIARLEGKEDEIIDLKQELGMASVLEVVLFVDTNEENSTPALVGHVSVVLFEAKKEVVDEQSDEAVV